ncbi:uncharacterized protein A4U43_UnF7120 [Asparagus officinalis]|uniref:Strictosidine synthase conserved region domain-containing protein n=1 Tax=Asparagus officinalis TaxID=4686 RepID=A0A1R3L6A0_ASPOF|nr:uncharacterized protein A4U43_UnF7120 [Asparagus officinalis]
MHPSYAPSDPPSHAPHLLLSSPPTLSPPSRGAAVVISALNDAFVSTTSGEIFTVDLDGKLSNLAQVSGGIKGVAHVNRGYLLALEKEKGHIFKVDAEDGAVKKVLISSSPDAESVAGGATGRAWLADLRRGVVEEVQDGWPRRRFTTNLRLKMGRR